MVGTRVSRNQEMLSRRDRGLLDGERSSVVVRNTHCPDVLEILSNIMRCSTFMILESKVVSIKKGGEWISLAVRKRRNPCKESCLLSF